MSLPQFYKHVGKVLSSEETVEGAFILKNSISNELDEQLIVF